MANLIRCQFPQRVYCCCCLARHQMVIATSRTQLHFAIADGIFARNDQGNSVLGNALFYRQSDRKFLDNLKSHKINNLNGSFWFKLNLLVFHQQTKFWPLDGRFWATSGHPHLPVWWWLISSQLLNGKIFSPLPVPILCSQIECVLPSWLQGWIFSMFCYPSYAVWQR